jgi:antitoxin ParD1/3/4
MSTAEKISITLTPEMNRMIKSRVEAGEYGSTSELIREALRVWQKRDEEHYARIAGIRSRINASIADPRPSSSLAQSRADFLSHVESKRKSTL